MGAKRPRGFAGNDFEVTSIFFVYKIVLFLKTGYDGFTKASPSQLTRMFRAPSNVLDRVAAPRLSGSGRIVPLTSEIWQRRSLLKTT